MKNVAEIINIAESGDLTGAHQALDGLLGMGPNNVEALKLRARLFEVAGRFQQEAKIWEQVAKVIFAVREVGFSARPIYDTFD